VKLLSTIAGIVGVILLVVAVLGRIMGSWSFGIIGTNIAYGNVLLLANTAFVLAIFLRLHGKD
jgi:hypothetical protein